MKKILSLFVMICLSLFFIWAVMSWYFGVQAENEFRKTLDNQTEKLGEKPFRLELLYYKKHFLGSSASVRVSSDIPLLNDWLGDFVLDLSSLNGPFFLTKKGVDIGASRWFIRIDLESFSPESEENLRRIFPEALPEGVLIVGFDKESSFYTSFKTEWLESTLSAIYNLTTFSYRGSFDISKLNYVSQSFNVSASEGTVSFQYPNIFETNNQKTLASDLNNPQVVISKTASLLIPRLTINHKYLSSTSSEPIQVSTKGNSNITINNNMIDAFVNVDLSKLSSSSVNDTKTIPIQDLSITTHIKDIQQSNFLGLMETKAELDNLMMQTQWELEEHGEIPEGQDKIWQIQNQIDTLKQQYPVSFSKAIFPTESNSENINSRNIILEMKSSNSQGQSLLTGYLKPATEINDSTRFVDLFEAKAKVMLDDLLHEFISKQSSIKKKQFELSYKQNKLLMH